MERLQATAVPRQEFNPGVVARLMREDPAVVGTCWLSSPYVTRPGTVEYLFITQAGLDLLRRISEA